MLQVTNNTSFKSRNKTIRFADDIARRVNNCYPRISPSNLDDFINIRCFRKFRQDIGERLENDVRDSIEKALYNNDNTIGKLLSFIKPVKKHRVANCGESALIAGILAKVNGIKNCFVASLRRKDGKSLDHSVIYVDEPKPYIIDTWLGFADYAENAFLRYKNEFRHHFDNIEDEDKLIFTKLENDYTEYLNQEFSRTQINKLKRIYPKHVIKRGYV